MNYCGYCGYKINNVNYKFCTNCGKQLLKEENNEELYITDIKNQNELDNSLSKLKKMYSTTRLKVMGYIVGGSTIVTVRKTHNCIECLTDIKIGEKAVISKAWKIKYGRKYIESYYRHTTCMKKSISELLNKVY